MNLNLGAQPARSEHWIARQRLFQQELDSVKQHGIVFLGNSITEGFDLDHYFPESRPVNRGISGDHIDGLLDRLPESVIRLKPSRLFILIGINDIGSGKSDSTIVADFEHLAKRLTAELEETEVIVQSILPTSAQWSNCPRDKIKRLNKDFKDIALKFNCRWLDLYPYFADDHGYIKPEFTSDGLHLSKEGYRQWQKILNTLEIR